MRSVLKLYGHHPRESPEMEVESLHLLKEAGVEMIIAIDSTRRGPALGGCRWKPYPDSLSARRDACDLAAAMTRKAALARLALGGGKSVVVGDPALRTREQLLAFGAFVERLEGTYITAADMGTGEPEMTIIAEATSHVLGLPVEAGGCGDPSPYTARGVLLAIEAALGHRDRELKGAAVAVQGAGSVGSRLVELLIEAGARVRVADRSEQALAALPPGAEVVPAEGIFEQPCDVIAPCGPPRVIDSPVAERVSCAVVCGAANNPLADPGVARQLEARGILYVPDFLANAGGLIHLAVAREGGDSAASIARLRIIPENLSAVLDLAKSERVDVASAAERLALSIVAGVDDAPDLG